MAEADGENLLGKKMTPLDNLNGGEVRGVAGFCCR